MWLQLKVIFVSGDRSEAEFSAYFKTMSFEGACAFETPEIEELNGKYKVSGIPTLLLLDAEGKLVTNDARAGVMSDPAGASFPWPEKSPFEGKILDAEGKVVARADLDALEAVGLYFSASW